MPPNRPEPPPGFTSDPQANRPPSTLPPSSPAPQPDPPPPLPADFDAPTPTEAAALESWLRRHEPYLTTIPWHRYATLPALAPLWGYADADFRAECLESLLFYTRAAGRKLTDDERDAVLAPIARTAAAAGYDRPVALGVAAWAMARSWAKGGVRDVIRREAATAAAAAAAAASAAAAGATPLGVGHVGPGGHITHFAQPPQRQQHGGFAGGAAGRRAAVGSVLRRVARTSVVGFSCAVGYYALWTPYRLFLGTHEVESIRDDLRLEKMCADMDENMKDKMANLMRKYGGS